jgi:hypothetical protein
MQLNRKLIVMTAMVAVVISAVAFTSPKEEDHGFKNLKILPKNISHEQLGKIMHGFNDALGVHCDFCHARSKDPNEKHPDFVSDEKPEKNMARSMMKMTVKINKKFFEVKGAAIGDTSLVVTCGTCHHGKPHPEAPKGEEREHMGPPPPPPGNDNH